MVSITADIYIFNPEHDLALAHGAHNYTAPPFARRLARDLRLLPAWVAAPGSLVAVPDDVSIDADRRWLAAQGLAVAPIHWSKIAKLGPCRIRPWGWNAALRYRLQQAGVPLECLPDDDALEQIRRLSHRRVTIAMHHALAPFMGLPPCPVELRTAQAVRDFMATHPGCYLKMPWSGSGKGIYRVLDPMGDSHVGKWIAGALRRQGALLGEAGLDCVQDFAIECECEDGKTRLTGYSLFDSDFHSQFGQGRVAPMAELHQLLTGRYPALDETVNRVLAALDGIVAPHYSGPLGVDMMLYRTPAGAIALNPCVEINLRMTMGMVTAALGERHGMRGMFATHGEGQPLTPMDDQTRYRACLSSPSHR